ncbi:MAG: hypothetical protein IJX46_08110 [Clostridia bacterium]|nr:hypothetical protein [Clostridia bacterium]
MNFIKKPIALLLCAVIVLAALCGCAPTGQGSTDTTSEPIGTDESYVEIKNGETLELAVGQSLRLSVDSSEPGISFATVDTCVTVSADGVVTAKQVGTATVTAICGNATDSIKIKVIDPRSLSLTADSYYTEVGVSVTLNVTSEEGLDGEPAFELSGDTAAFTLDGNRLTPVAAGSVTVRAKLDGVVSNEITVTSFEPNLQDPQEIVLTVDRPELFVGDVATLEFEIYPGASSCNIVFSVTEGEGVVSIAGNRITAISAGQAKIVGRIGGTVSNEITVKVALFDPYAELTCDEFYENYTVATSYSDACLRSEYGFMSGYLTVPDQAPTVAENRPSENGVLIRNDTFLYTDSGNGYIVTDSTGVEVLRVYRGGAYITLEEVAAYIYAFGEIPANYSTGKKATATLLDTWGEYLRLNHSRFNGNVTKYPYQPILPNISGCGGDLQYMELDIGTTGTDCDPGYIVRPYNDGKTVTRGAARIVYGKDDKNGNGVYEQGELHLFYTYNHYNDFQEYLNYYGGWGNIFGNVTGGGKLSSKYDYNPTPYIAVIIAPIRRETD